MITLALLVFSALARPVSALDDETVLLHDVVKTKVDPGYLKKFASTQAENVHKMTNMAQEWFSHTQADNANPFWETMLHMNEWVVQANMHMLSTGVDMYEAMLGNVIKFNEEILENDDVAKTVGFKKLGTELNERLSVAAKTLQSLTDKTKAASYKAVGVYSDLGHMVAEKQGRGDYSAGVLLSELEAAHGAGAEYARSLLEVAHTAQDRAREEIRLARERSKKEMKDAMDSVKSEGVKTLVDQACASLEAAGLLLDNLGSIQQRAESELMQSGADHLLVAARALGSEASTIKDGAGVMNKLMAVGKELQGDQRMQAAGVRFMQDATQEMQRFAQTMRAIVGPGLAQLSLATKLIQDGHEAVRTQVQAIHKQAMRGHDKDDHSHH